MLSSVGFIFVYCFSVVGAGCPPHILGVGCFRPRHAVKLGNAHSLVKTFFPTKKPPAPFETDGFRITEADYGMVTRARPRVSAGVKPNKHSKLA